MKVWFPTASFPLFAHEGGWDEILLVVGPLAVIGLALWFANKRVTNQLDESDSGALPEHRD